jgi:type IV pilus assembly protein PilX
VHNHLPTMATPLHSLQPHDAQRHPQRGVVLIVSLIMLVIISLLASFSIRNATSTEAVSGNVRTTQLASQAAEFAMNYCATGMDQLGSPTATVVVTPLGYASPPRATQKDANGNLIHWDGTSSIASNAVIVIPSAALGGTTTFKRMPECMIEPMMVVNSTGTGTTTTSTYVITARGFGPEVAAADASRTRPIGSEVWIQATDD